MKPRIHFVANCVYSNHIAGGDIHFFEMARAALASGYDVNFFGGHALKRHLEDQKIAATTTLTDNRQHPGIDLGRFSGQAALFADYSRRYRTSLHRLCEIQPHDLVYAVTDFWFDVLPAVRSNARGKMMVWHMQAPTLNQVARRSRPDVDSARIASLHYWFGQKLSLARFGKCPVKRLLYVHPAMRRELLIRGFRPDEIKYVSFGVEPSPPGSEAVEKRYDVVWIGRVHRQKGVDDLLATLAYLSKVIPDFRAVIIGKVERELKPQVEELGLGRFIHFAGFVSEEEKFRLFRESRVYLMPSRFEGSPRVIGEALVCNLPVVAYEVETYRPVFGDFLRYVAPYDLQAFGAESERQVLAMRKGENYLSRLNLGQFKKDCSWETARNTFVQAVRELESVP
jgi:glycosyltransferase involved in cell wall biosynthesis